MRSNSLSRMYRSPALLPSLPAYAEFACYVIRWAQSLVAAVRRKNLTYSGP